MAEPASILCPIVRVRAGSNPDRDPLQDWRRGPYYFADYPTETTRHGSPKPGELALLLPPGVVLPEQVLQMLGLPQWAWAILRRPTLVKPGPQMQSARANKDGTFEFVHVLRIDMPGDFFNLHCFAEGECAAALLGVKPDMLFNPSISAPQVREEEKAAAAGQPFTLHLDVPPAAQGFTMKIEVSPGTA